MKTIQYISCSIPHIITVLLYLLRIRLQLKKNYKKRANPNKMNDHSNKLNINRFLFNCFLARFLLVYCERNCTQILRGFVTLIFVMVRKKALINGLTIN